MEVRRTSKKQAFLSEDFSRVLEEQVRATDDFVRDQERALDRAAAQIESQIQAIASEFATDEELDRLRKLYATAREEAQTLERRCEELSRGRRKVGGEPVAGGSAFDWEKRKRSMLASLGTEGEASDDDDRLTIDGTISITDAVIVEKDRQIAELRRKVEELEVLGAVVSPEQQVLNADEFIRTERERLAKLDAELQEKRSHSEVEVSKERAALARERAELDELKQSIESGQYNTPSGELAQPQKPSRGRWLARLGLKSEDVDNR